MKEKPPAVMATEMVKRKEVVVTKASGVIRLDSRTDVSSNTPDNIDGWQIPETSKPVSASSQMHKKYDFPRKQFDKSGGYTP